MILAIILTGLLAFVTGIDGAKMCKCNWLHHRGHCYLFSEKTSLNWNDAGDFCRGQGGYLAKLNDRAEAEWIRKIAKELRHKSKIGRAYWLGGSDATFEGQWRWTIDHEKVAFNFWGPREPNNVGNNEHCLEAMSNHDYKWNDMPCTTKRQHICESPVFNKPACKCDA